MTVITLTILKKALTRLSETGEDRFCHLRYNNNTHKDDYVVLYSGDPYMNMVICPICLLEELQKIME